MLQGIVLAVASALGKAADDTGDDSLNDRDVELPEWASRVLVWVLGLWVRDDSGVSIVDTVMNHIVTVCICVFASCTLRVHVLL